MLNKIRKILQHFKKSIINSFIFSFFSIFLILFIFNAIQATFIQKTHFELKILMWFPAFLLLSIPSLISGAIIDRISEEYRYTFNKLLNPFSMQCFLVGFLCSFLPAIPVVIFLSIYWMTASGPAIAFEPGIEVSAFLSLFYGCLAVMAGRVIHRKSVARFEKQLESAGE